MILFSVVFAKNQKDEGLPMTNGTSDDLRIQFPPEFRVQPSDIRIEPYRLPNTFGNAEMEEAAARLLYHSVVAEGWVEVPFSKLFEDAKRDRENMILIERYPTRIEELIVPAHTIVRLKGVTAVVTGLHKLSYTENVGVRKEGENIFLRPTMVLISSVYTVQNHPLLTP